MEGRAGYYDTAGALRDMVQNHMLQLLCLVAMEPPTSIDADAVRDEKLKVLKSLKQIDGNAANVTVRGPVSRRRFGQLVRSRVISKNSARRRARPRPSLPSRRRSRTGAGAGVPFFLRTGKRLGSRLSEIVVGFKHIPHSVFDGQAGPITENRLVIRLQPDEGVRLWLMIKDPGPGGMRLQLVPLDMSFAKAFGGA